MRRAGLALAVVVSALARPAGNARADDVVTPVRIGPSADGHLGAWLVLGPYRSASNGIKVKAPDPLLTSPPDVDEDHLVASLGSEGPKQTGMKDAPKWLLASSGDGAVDVKGALSARGTDLVAYAAGTLHLARATKLLLLLGADDGLRVSVDGRVLFSRDEARPQRDDDDLVPLDLGAGEHKILLKIHQRDGAWSFRARLVDEHLLPPEGAWLELPGTSVADATTLATKMSWVSVERTLRADGYAPRVTVRYPEGVPLGVPLRVTAKLPSFFDIDAGEVPRATGELVVTLPRLAGADLPLLEDRATAIVVHVAGREVTSRFFPKKSVRESVARADETFAKLAAAPPAFLLPDSLDAMRLARQRIAGFVGRGDMDGDALSAEAKTLDAALAKIATGEDPYVGRTGVLRMAYTSPVDGELSEYGLYVPPSYKPGGTKRYPLVVVLHGLNGKPLAMLRWFFGGDDVAKDQDWEDRHSEPLAPLEAFVLSPTAHGNTMYRDLGEDDVMRVLDRVSARWPVDRDRVTITGPSMGGIGAAAIPLRHPDRFAAAAPLCGYHSYFVRRDVAGRPIRPWERVVASERSNVDWALNGAALPLFIVHGTQDLPIENSQVLIDQYEKLKYSVVHEHPNLGHNVWQTTYEDLKGAKWLVAHTRDPHPNHLRFRTIRPRDGDDAWVHVTELGAPDAWGQLDARIQDKHTLTATTSGIAELRFDRDSKLVDDRAPVTLTLDGTPLSFDASAPMIAHKDGAAWKAGPATHTVPWKRGEITGPFRDAYHAPLLFVWGASKDGEARANEEVARSFAAVRYGVSVKYPVMSDLEFEARGESLANDHALFLVGNAASNKVVRALEADLPIRVDGDAVVIGTQRITGNQLGAAFIRPNPKRPDRYLVVVEGTSALGTWRALSLPDLLPDFVVYDDRVASSRGQMLLSAGMVRAAGFFKNDWSLPDTFDDPLAATVRPAAKTEYDATPYLP